MKRAKEDQKYENEIKFLVLSSYHHTLYTDPQWLLIMTYF